MSLPELRVSYEAEDEWHGQLTAVARSGEFGGKGSAWFSRHHVQQTFIAGLREFPLSTNKLPIIEGGFWARGAETLDQCHLRIAVRPYNSRGSLLVQVDLATPCHTTADQDRQQTVTVRLLTDYASIERFAEDLTKVLDGQAEVALLTGIENG